MPGRPGRPKGSLSKTTLERIRLAHNSLQDAAKRRIATPNRSAIEVMREIMARFAGQALEHFNNKNWDNALLYGREASIVAGKLAPYEAPQLQSVTVTRVDPYQHLNDGDLYKELVKRAAAIGLHPKALPKAVEAEVLRETTEPEKP